MISFFRRIVGSKFGALLGLAFLGLIAFAFAAGDLGNTGNFGSFGGGSATKIGSQSLPESELQSRVQRVYEQNRRENPGLKIDDFLAQGPVPQIYDQLVAGIALSEYARTQGVHVSKRMVDARIASIPAFQDAAGNFSQSLFRQMITAQGISEKAIREDIAKELTGQIMISPAGLGTKLSDSLVLPYASLLLEAREGRIAAIPSAAFMPKEKPTDEQLKKYYADNAGRYTVPEQRALRYAIVDLQRFDDNAAPTEAEIKAYYEKNKARYAARETRTIKQLILPTQDAAKSAAAAGSLEKAAQASGLSVATFEKKSKAGFASEASKEAADAAFAADKGKIVGPVKLALGWAVLQISDIQSIAAQSLDAASPGITITLQAEKRATLLSDFIAKIEDDVANGATFDETVKDNALTVETTPFVLATGQSVEQADYRPNEAVAKMLKPGFDMEGDDDPQFVALKQQEQYALLDVTDIKEPAPPPLEKVKPVIVQQYMVSQGAKKAKALADKLKGQIDKSEKEDGSKAQAFAKALSGAGVRLPPAQNIAGRRADLLRQDKRPPAEVSILFAMAPSTVKIMPIPNDQGYFLIMLNSITEGDAAKVPGLVDRVRGDITNVVASEYGDQFERAIERELGIKRNAAALAGATRALREANGAVVQ